MDLKYISVSRYGGCLGVIFTVVFFLMGAAGAFGFEIDLLSPSDGEVLDVSAGNASWNFTFNASVPAGLSTFPNATCALFWNASPSGPNASVSWMPLKQIIYTNGTIKNVSHPAIPNGIYEWNVMCEDPPNDPAWAREWEFNETNWTFIIVNSSLPDCGVLNDTACGTTSDCTWEPYGGLCLLDCFQYDSYNSGNETACNSAYGNYTCEWKPDPSADGGGGLCDPSFFNMGFDGASPCFEYDGNKTGCGTLPDTCSWFSEPNCPSGDPCEDVTNGTEHGWCDPQGKFDFSQDKPCWQFDGNKTGCDNIRDEQAWPCEWFPDPWGEDKTGEGGGWCDMTFYGGAEGCWDFADNESCNNAADIGCTWELDPFNPQGGFCREQGCWDFDNFNTSIQGNESCTEFSANVSFITCIWENTTANNTTGWCTEEWKDFACSQNDNNSKACFDTFYCVWDDPQCKDPMELGGPGFFEPKGPNPGCFILQGEQKCNEVTTCEWNATTTNCEDNSSAPPDPAMGIQCSDINNSAFCSNIPFLSSCCKWNTTLSNNTCVDASYETGCWDNMQAPPPGANFCEDYNAINNATLCNDIAGDPWYMPCKWDNSTTPNECRFAFEDMFAGKDMFDMGFDDFSSKAGCEQIGGVWFQEKWSDPLGNIFIDEWCEVGMGQGYDTCNTSCWACEYQDNGSNWENGTAMKDACESSAANSLNGCTFINNTDAMNGIGWCDVNFNFTSFDFEFEDCFTPWADSDGDGLLPDADPDCNEFFKWGGYIEAETGHECGDGIDNDGNNQTDCDDLSCKYDPFFCSGNVSEDIDPPEIKLLTLDRYTDGAFFDIVTNEPTNATILFYYNDSACNPGNQSNVTDPKLNNTAEEWTQFDDYDLWHGIPVDTNYLAGLGYNGSLTNGTTYFYKAQVFDKAGNNATGRCSNFTTLNETVNFTVGFKLPPPKDDNTTMLGYLRIQFDWDGDGVFEDNQSSDSDKKKVNKSKAKKINIRFFNPFATDAWEIQIRGAHFKDKDGGRVLNITNAFVVNNSGTDIVVGMKKSVWSELAQKLGADYLRIIIPKGSSGLTDVTVNHCPDNATAADQSDCNSVYNATDTTKADCTIEADRTICDIPVNIGFSVFGVSGVVASSPPSTGGGGGGGPTDEDKIQNATISGGKATTTFSKIAAGKTGTIVIPDTADVPFKELAIKVKNKVLNIKIEVYTLSKKPGDITEDISTGVIQSYIKLDETNIQATDIDTVTIKFKVPVSWINDNSIDRGTVALNRYADDKWTALTTTKTSEDSDYVYYSANSPGLSVFGISGQVQTVTTTTTPPVTTTAPATVAPATTAPPAAPTTTVPPVVEEPKKGICGPTTVLLLAMLFPVLSRIRRKL